MEKLNNNEQNRIIKKGRIIMSAYIGLVLAMTLGAGLVFADNDPITVVNNLSNFIFSLIRAIGLILLGLGIMQVGLSLKSHDPSQRANGFLTLAGGTGFERKTALGSLVHLQQVPGVVHNHQPGGQAFQHRGKRIVFGLQGRYQALQLLIRKLADLL